MEKLKIYLKGFDRPYSVFGYRLFEDERFLVVQIEGSKRWIPWENLLYIESLESLLPPEDFAEEPISAPAIPIGPTAATQGPPPKPSEEFLSMKLEEAKTKLGYKPKIDTGSESGTTNVSVNFTGYKVKTFSIDVPTKTMLSGKFGPDLSRAISASPQIAAFMGDFIIDYGQSKVDGSNIYIATLPAQASQPQIKPEMLGPAKETLEMTTNLLKSLAGSANRPKMPSLGADVNFSMPGSPFTTPVSLQDSDEGQ